MKGCFVMVNLALIDAAPVDYGHGEAATAAYRAEGTERALALESPDELGI